MSDAMAIQALPELSAQETVGKQQSLGNLILSGRAQQSIVIGENIRITILTVGDKNVRLALEAPKEVTIFRQELLEKMRKTQSKKIIKKNKRSEDASQVTGEKINRCT